MTRKQEIIDAIWEHLRKFPDFKAPEWYTKKKSEALYDIIAPLIRGEFPEEGIKRLMDAHLRIGYFYYPGHRVIGKDIVISGFKRLWEADHIAEYGKSVGLRPDAQDERNKQASRGLAQIEAMQPKSTCRMCGGEFPVLETQALIARSRLRDESQNYNVHSLAEVTGWFKSLWEGQPQRKGDDLYELGSRPCPKCGYPVNTWDKVCPACEQREGDNVLEQDEETTDEVVADISRHLQSNRSKRGTCPTCGGSGFEGGASKDFVPSASSLIQETDKDCPACKGTGECQHNDIKAYGGCLYCRDCNQYIKERRSGEKRRLIRRRVTDWPSNRDRRGTDRRKPADRRKVLPLGATSTTSGSSWR